MTPEYDIFRVEKDRLTWLEPAITLDDAKARIQQRGATKPGDYFIFHQNNGDRFQVTVRAS
jgi:hypothetical protein